MKLAIFSILLSSTITNLATASETDPFSLRHLDLPDVTSELNAEVDHRIEVAIDLANHRNQRLLGNTCRELPLQRQLKKQLRRKLYGKIEGWLNNSSLPRARVTLAQSIYSEFRFLDNVPVRLGVMGIGYTFVSGGNYVGGDKLGHFMDEGYNYFKRVKNKGISLEQAMLWGKKTEDGFFGLATTGVYSYADTVANYQGYHFWARMTESGHDGQQEPYILCEGGKFIRNQKATFDFADYIDAGWDESVNCSKFRSERLENLVAERISSLESLYGESLTCPVAPQACVDLVSKYGQHAKMLLHPSCFRAQ